METLDLVAVHPIKITVNFESNPDLPVENIEEAVQTQHCHIVTCEIFYNANLLQHNDLRDECQCLKPQRKAPCQFPGSNARMTNSSQYGSSREQNFQVRKLIAKRIVRGAERLLISHEEDDETSRPDEEDLHRGIIDANEVHEEVHVARAED